MLKRFTAWGISLSLILTTCCLQVQSVHAMDIKPNLEVKTLFNGYLEKIQKPMILYRNTVMVPVRDVMSAMGADGKTASIFWDAQEKTVTLVYEDKTFKVRENRSQAWAGGKKFKLRYLPFLYEGSFYISYVELAENLGWQSIWEPEAKLLAFSDTEKYLRNQALLENIAFKLDSQARLGVQIRFDNDEEEMLFDFRIDNENRLLNGSFQANKTFENKLVTEKSELFIRGENFFVKDYKINQWRLDEAANFDVASSFLKMFSSKHMLQFNHLAYMTFRYRNTSKGGILANDIPFNDFLRREMGFSSSQSFHYKMNFNENDQSIRNISLMNTINYGSMIRTGRMDIDFQAYGSPIQIQIPKASEFAQSNADDIRKLKTIQKALILFLLDAEQEAMQTLENCKTVDALIALLQTSIEITVNQERMTYGPYLTRMPGKEKPDSQDYKPMEGEKKGFQISIDKSKFSVEIELSDVDRLIFK